MAKEGALVAFGMMTIWAVAYIATRSLTQPFWNQVENFIAGTATGNNGGNGGMS
jgi:hypothetical protein